MCKREKIRKKKIMNRWIWFQKLTLLQRPVDVVLLQGPVDVVLTWLNLESKTLW